LAGEWSLCTVTAARAVDQKGNILETMILKPDSDIAEKLFEAK